MLNNIKIYIVSLLTCITTKKNIVFFILMGIILCFLKTYSSTINLYLFLIIISTIIFQTLLLQKKNYALFLIRTFLFVLILLELICGLLIENDPLKSLKQVKNNDANYEQNNIMGYVLSPNLNAFRSIKLIDKDTLYDVFYSSDKYSRRVSEKTNFSNTAKKHALFLGCSITFGEGINFESTFPYLFEKNNSDYNAYNYGFSGYGPHQMALLFSKGVNTINKKSVLEKTGFMLYSFIEDHLSRVYGGSNYLLYGSQSPDIYIENNHLITKKRNKYHLYLARFINQSKTLKYFNIALTYPKTEIFYKRFASIVNYSATEYKKIFPTGVFYVSFYPQKKHDTSWIKYLHKDIKIIIINPPSDFYSNIKRYVIRPNIDNHPIGALNKYYSNKITENINRH